jgi:hypothetical protein
MAKLPTATFPARKSKLIETVTDSIHDMRQENVESVSKGGDINTTIKVEGDNDVASTTLLEDGKEVKVEFTCEMCSETFTKRSELLIHVPIHI